MRLFDMELSTCFSMKGLYCVLLLVVVAGFDVVGGAGWGGSGRDLESEVDNQTKDVSASGVG